MILSIASGKGGTGKTSLAANIAVSVGRGIQILDCDVEEPNMHLLLHPKIVGEKTVYNLVPSINEELCDHCGKCARFCPYNALFVTPTEVLVFHELCHGCGVCKLVCPANAIALTERITGYVYLSKIRHEFMVHALLNPGEANSGKLVATVRQNAKILAEKEKIDILIIDGPPGIGCPVISSVAGVDVGLVVTEPTVSGIHDLERIWRRVLSVIGPSKSTNC